MREQIPPREIADLYRSAPIGLCYFDTRLRFVHINDWLAAINGFSVQEHLGKTLGELLPGVAKGVMGQLRRVIETGESIIDGEVEAKTAAHPEEVRIYLHNYFARKSPEGVVLGVSCSVRDITDLRKDQEQLRRLRDEIAARESVELELKGLARRMVGAQEEDRARIARELHDDISQRLAAAAIGLELALPLVATDPDGATERLHGCRAQLERVSDDVRNIAHDLHPETLKNLGLATALEGLSEEAGVSGAVKTRVTLGATLERHVSQEAALCLYRIAQESLRNIAKHANATEVEMDATAQPGGIRLIVRDNGDGFDPDVGQPGLGLASMRERARLLNGTLTVASRLGRGTVVQVDLPA